jgi:hypothetical protein
LYCFSHNHGYWQGDKPGICPHPTPGFLEKSKLLEEEMLKKLVTEIKIVFRKISFYPEYPMATSKISRKRLNRNFIA